MFCSDNLQPTSGITSAKLLFGSCVLWEHLSPRPGVARFKRQQHIRRPLWNEWGIEDIKSCFFVKKYIWVLVSAGSARNWFNCSELPQCDLFCLYQTYALAWNSVFHLFWCAITHTRAKVSIQRVRRLAILPAEPSDDNPHILLQPKTDNGALSCTVANGLSMALQRLLYNPVPWKDVWNVTENSPRLSPKLWPLLHKSHPFRARHTKGEKKPSATINAAANRMLHSEGCRAASNGNICSPNKWSHLVCMTS